MDKTLKDLLQNTNVMVIIDTSGKVMYYENYNDTIVNKSIDDVVGCSIYELYPFFKREDFTVFKAIDERRAIVNEYQTFTINGHTKKAINSAFPLINGTGVVGGMVISYEMDNQITKKIYQRQLVAKYSFNDILTKNKNFKEELEKLKKISHNDSNILIYGETGTGKELIAHAIHSESRRSQKPLIIQNCASIPSTLMESILFGTSKGSFTGAMDKEGIFEAAQGGTIFLDEINSMPMDLQSKVLRAIENRTIMRIGETNERDIDVRIIASTNEILADKVAIGEFRADLYYRLNVVEFVIPPLRNRKDDIMFLAEYYLDFYNSLMEKNIKGMTEKTVDILENYRWNGNVRELKNVIEHITNIKDTGMISEADLPQYLRKTTVQNTVETKGDTGEIKLRGKLSEQMDAIERKIIEDTYIKCRYNASKTAEELGLPRQTLYYKLKKYNI